MTDFVDFPTAHVTRLMGLGYTRNSIAGGAGLDRTTVLQGLRRGHCTARTRELLLNLDTEDCPTQPAWRSARRIRALMAAGIPGKTIAATSGIAANDISMLARNRGRYTRRETFRGIDRAWHRWKDEPVRVALPHIEEKGWAVPWEWDDIDGEVDLHGDPLVPSRHVVGALRRAVGWWGRARTAEVLDTTEERLARIAKRSRVRQSTHDDILARIEREKGRLAFRDRAARARATHEMKEPA